MHLGAWWSLAGLSGCVVFAAVAGGRGGGGRATPGVMVSPPTGGLGTLITLAVSPQVEGFELRPGTTARWEGVYDPPVGANTPTFAVDFAGADIVIADQWTARVLIGGGTITNGPNVENVMGGGSLVGTFTLTTPPACPGDATFDNVVNFADTTSVITNWGANYGAGSTGPGDANRDGVVNFTDVTSVLEHWGAVCSDTVVQGSATIGLNTNAAEWHLIEYPSGYGGLSPPGLGRLVTGDIPSMNFLDLPDGASPPLFTVQAAIDAHLALAVSADRNAQSHAAAPPNIAVDIVSFTATGTEVARLQSVLLTRIVPDPSPSLLVYTSAVSEPIMIVDTAPLNPANYPGFRFLPCPSNGTVGVVPPTQ